MRAYESVDSFNDWGGISCAIDLFLAKSDGFRKKIFLAVQSWPYCGFMPSIGMGDCFSRNST